MDKNIDIDFCKQIKLARHNEICTEIENLRNENFKAVVMMGQSAIKASMFIQAGALVIMMAFLNDESYVMPTSNGALLWQYGSVVAIVLSYVALWLGMYWSYAAIYMLIGR